MTMTSMAPIDPERLTGIGGGLNRPECVVAMRDGTLYTCDWTLGIARIDPDGTVSKAVEADLIGAGYLPNGIAVTPEGDFLFANLGEAGGVWRVGASGDVVPVATEVDGRQLPPTNFVLIDGERIWITVSASSRNHAHFTDEETTGQIILVENGQARVAADGLTWTNELRVSPDGKHLFVNETFACRTTRFEISADGGLMNPVHVEFPDGVFPDGMAFDAEGALWVVCVVSNKVIRIGPDLQWSLWFSDIDERAFAEVAAAHVAKRLTRDMIVDSRGATVANLSSLAFGGPDLAQLYFGSLSMNSVQCIDAPVAGMPMAHHA